MLTLVSDTYALRLPAVLDSAEYTLDLTTISPFTSRLESATVPLGASTP
jgi:hypothetical protein